MENNNIDDSYEPNKKQRCEIDPQQVLKNIRLDGLYFISKINHKNRSFIPSTKNYFGDWQVRKVLVDTGCSTYLLPIQEGQLSEFFKTFSSTSASTFPPPSTSTPEEFTFTVGVSITAGGKCPVLKVMEANGKDFHVKLCQDLVGNNSLISIDTLRFSLCSEDIDAILNTPEYTNLLTEVGLDILKTDLQNHPNRERRSHALLGTFVLKEMSCVRVTTIEFFVDAKVYDLPNWKTLRRETDKIIEQIELPTNFDEWEDDDNIGLDDGVDYECDDAD